MGGEEHPSKTCRRSMELRVGVICGMARALCSFDLLTLSLRSMLAVREYLIKRDRDSQSLRGTCTNFLRVGITRYCQQYESDARAMAQRLTAPSLPERNIAILDGRRLCCTRFQGLSVVGLGPGAPCRVLVLPRNMEPLLGRGLNRRVAGGSCGRYVTQNRQRGFHDSEEPVTNRSLLSN